MGTFTQSTLWTQNILMTNAYAGPGDVVFSAAGWWGLRAYSLAKCGTNAVRLRASGDNVESDFTTLSVTGNLDVASISTFQIAHGGNLFITKVYDQSGNGNDIAQATAGNQPQLILSGIGALPVIRHNGASFQFMDTASTMSVARPFTMLGCFKRTANFTTQQNCMQNNIAQGETLYFPTSANIFSFFKIGGDQSLAETDSVFHACIGTAKSSGNESAYVDALTATVGFTSLVDFTGNLRWGSGGSSTFPMYGDSLEVGVWPIEFSGAQAASMISNIKAYWGF